MSHELYKKHRPKAFKTVVGQPEAVKVLQEMVANNRVPHTLCFTGDSGCGKTTLARIVADKLECGKDDLVEVNCADFNGIEMVRDIRARMNLMPIRGKVRVWIIDEAHQLTSAAQNAFLKILEDTPTHVYFMLATTDPQKLLPTIRTRCTEVKVKSLSPAAARTLVQSTLQKENVKMSDDVVDKLVEHAEGSARKVLVLLNQVIGLETDDERIEAIQSSDHKAKAVELARLLLNHRVQWVECAKVLKGLEEDPESLRRMVLGYCNAVMINSPKMAPRCFLVIDCFSRNFFDSGKAGLSAACYDVCTSK